MGWLRGGRTGEPPAVTRQRAARRLAPEWASKMAERSSKAELRGNRLLDSLTAGEWAQLAGRLSPVTLPIKTVLFEPGQRIDAVHFPLDGVISLVTALEDGAIVEGA